jgi:hypothetical protein
VKAFGFVILTEGLLVFSHTEWLSLGGLATLAALNATGTATNLLRDKDETPEETTGGFVTLGLDSNQPLLKQPMKRLMKRKRGSSNSTPRVRAFRERQKAGKVTPIM